jgi:hypothetical protein
LAGTMAAATSVRMAPVMKVERVVMIRRPVR